MLPFMDILHSFVYVHQENQELLHVKNQPAVNLRAVMALDKTPS